MRDNDGKRINNRKIGMRKKGKVNFFLFSRENATENILQGGYQFCSDTIF